jgi:hypothetical protein
MVPGRRGRGGVVSRGRGRRAARYGGGDRGGPGPSSRSWVRRPDRVRRPAMASSRRRSVLGSATRSGPDNGVGVQVSRVVGEENDGQPDRVRCRVVKRQVGRPVSLAQRMRSSALARRRCRSFVRAVARRWCWWEAGDPPSVMSTGRSCAPWCGTLRRAMTRVRAGHPVRFSSPVIGHVGAVARFAVAVVGRGPRRLGEPVQGVGASCQVFCVRPCCWVRGSVRGRGWPSTNSAAAESPQLPSACAQFQQPPAPPPPTAAYSGALLPSP